MRRSAIAFVCLLSAAAAAGCIPVEEEGASTASSSSADEQVTEVGNPVNAGHVASCVEQIKFGAYTEDPTWSQTWADVGQSETGAVTHCTQLGEDTPARLAEIHDDWLQVEAFLAAAEPQAAAPPEPASAPALTVTRVVDGDTVDMSDGSTIRLIGIDSPEQGECGYEDATRHLESLVLGKPVTLTPGARDDVDRYGRLLRYLDVDGVDANRAQLEAGVAIARYDSNDGYGRHTREDDYRAVDFVVPMAGGCARPDAPATTASPAPPPPPPAPAPAPDPPTNVSYANCTAAREAGAAPVYAGDPGYGSHLDRDGDGVGCEN